MNFLDLGIYQRKYWMMFSANLSRQMIFLEMGPYDFERSEKLRHHSLVDRTIEPPDCVKEFSSALVGGFLQGILDAFRMFSCVTFSRFNGISRILEWRYQVPYFWPYFGGISPCIALKNRPHIWQVPPFQDPEIPIDSMPDSSHLYVSFLGDPCSASQVKLWRSATGTTFSRSPKCGEGGLGIPWVSPQNG